MEGEQEKVVILPKTKKVLTIIDEETGEILEYVTLKSKTLGKGWIALYQNPALWLAQQGLTGEQLNVMLYLFGKLNFDNYIRVSRKDISDWTHVHPVNVSKAMKELKDRDIIAEGPRAGMNKTYRLNPYIAYKGKERNKTIIDFQNLKKASKRK